MTMAALICHAHMYELLNRKQLLNLSDAHPVPSETTRCGINFFI